MSTHWMGACYIPLRDNHGKKSLSTAERDFLLQAASQSRPLRLDGRKPHQGRIDTTVLHLQRQYLYESSSTTGSSPSSSSTAAGGAAGSMSSTSTATVVWAGATRVHATCTAQMVPPPLPDRPNEGRVNLSVSLSAAARTSFRHGPPATNGGSSSNKSGGGGVEDVEQKRLTNRILRTLERLLGPTTLDPEALCIVAGHWVWQLDVTVTVLDAAAGNVLDAAVFGTLAAVRHYRKLHVQIADNDNRGPPTLIPAHTKEPTPLPLHHTPLTVSFGLLRLPASMRQQQQGDQNEDSLVLLLDPSAREELVLEAAEHDMESTVLCLAMNAHHETVWMDWAGCPVSLETLQQAHEACRIQVSGLTQSLEDALQKAHAQATAQQLQELQRRDNAELLALPPMPDDSNVALPPAAPPVWKSLHQTTAAANTVVSQEEDMQDDDNVTAVNAAAAALAAEEAHRQDALDYNKGHMTTKVRDNDNASRNKQQSSTSALLQALLQSVTTPSKGSSTKQPASSATKPVGATAALQSEPMQVDTPETSTAPVAARAEAAVPIKKTAPPAATMDDDDDEEETMQLQSEFATVAAPAPAPSPAPVPQPPQVNDNDDDDDDVDDLAAAVVKKKKKKSKKK